MNKFLPYFIFFLLCIIGLRAQVGDGPAYLNVYNKHGSDVFVWVNGKYQGYVPSGVMAYMPREGFATLDSGVQADGSVKADHAYGGWERRAQLDILVAGFEGGDPEKPVLWRAVAGSERADDFFLWVGPATYEAALGQKEFVRKMTRKALPPTLTKAINDGGSQPTDPAQVLRGGASPAQSYEFLRLGQKKAEIAEGDFTIPGLNLQMVSIKAGTFRMGSENGNPNEKPVTTVSLTKSYWLGKTEVTQAQWQALMGGNPSKFTGSNRPVENVSWDEAMVFCRKLTESERTAGRLPAGYGYQLPTEAQWEYACRAGTTDNYAGNLDALAWYDANSGGQTHPVAKKQPNAWGLYDMHGNVFEWCLDWYGNYGGGNITDSTGPATGSERVIRGGSWFTDANPSRSAYRLYSSSDTSTHFVSFGFRVALSSVH
jgi:formylglycine-generating enzyme required for sulfatase activity